MTSESDILDFAGASFRSVWALELLLMLRERRERTWAPAEILRELRSSQVAVVEALNNLIVAGLVVEEEVERYRYSATGRLEEAVGALASLYALKPAVVMRQIVNSPNNAKLQILSDAFRIKDE
ncbi:MAG: hypothetical protein ACTHLO_18370 [Pseudolabrys sp.]